MAGGHGNRDDLVPDPDSSGNLDGGADTQGRDIGPQDRRQYGQSRSRPG